MTDTAEIVWDRYKIREEVRRRKTTLAALARANDLSPSTCSLALVRPSPSGERVIAQFLGIPPNQLWPDRYDHLGCRMSTRKPRKRQQLLAAE